MQIRQFLWIALFLSLQGGNTFAADNPKISFQTNHGNFVVELYPEKAPKTVANFMQYVADKFYDGTLFHRTIQSFMIQGGGFTPDMKEKPTRPAIVNEAANGLSNEIGTIAMARTYIPDSATSQFFINVANNIPLNYQGDDPETIGYCVFGKVISGMDVIQKISKLPTKSIGEYDDVPSKPVVIEKARVL